MAIEIKNKKENFNWVLLLFVFSCLILIFLIISFFFFRIKTNNMEEEITLLNRQMQEEEELQEKLNIVQQRLNIAESALINQGIVAFKELPKGELINNKQDCENKNYHWYNNKCYVDVSFTDLLINKAFNSLQESIHPNIWFVSLDFSFDTSKVVIRGVAQDITSFKQQITIFQEKLNNFNLIGYSIAENQEVNFSFDFTVDTQNLP